MRTDSVNLSQKALTDAVQVIGEQFGREYILSEPRRYKTKSKGAQEAHEAIRPTELAQTPQSLRDALDSQQLKLYTLIWNRTMATQMPPAELKRVGVDIAANNYTFRATGQTVTFDGFLRVYSEGRDEPEGAEAAETDDESQKLLPALAKGDNLHCEGLEPQQHFTKPPPRYTEASLVKKLEEEGIGRPSTYAPTISTIQQRGYIHKEGRQLQPEEVAFTVTDLLAEHFSDIVNLSFTAKMEQSLDDIAEGKAVRASFLEAFYNPFNELVQKKTESIKREDVRKEVVLGKDPATGLDILARSGRFGPYVQLGRVEDLPKDQKPRSASLPKGTMTDTATLEQAMELLAFPKDIGSIGGETVQVSLGRFGPYIKCGKQNASIPEGTNPASVTLEDAKRLLKETKERKKKQETPLKVFGNDPTSGGEIQLKEGRYGPYVTDGTTNASLPKSVAPDNVDMQFAIQLLDKKRNSPKRNWKRKK
jgi:DNA topoisomerase-1